MTATDQWINLQKHFGQMHRASEQLTKHAAFDQMSNVWPNARTFLQMHTHCAFGQMHCAFGHIYKQCPNVSAFDQMHGQLHCKFVQLCSELGNISWRRSTVVERWSLTGELSMSCAWLLAGRMITLWFRRPLSVSQHGQLSHPSLRLIHVIRYMDYGVKAWHGWLGRSMPAGSITAGS